MRGITLQNSAWEERRKWKNIPALIPLPLSHTFWWNLQVRCLSLQKETVAYWRLYKGNIDCKEWKYILWFLFSISSLKSLQSTNQKVPKPQVAVHLWLGCGWVFCWFCLGFCLVGLGFFGFGFVFFVNPH